MKTFTFNVNKKTTKNNNEYDFRSNSAYIDTLVLTNLKKTAPYLFTSNGTIDKDYKPTIVLPKNKSIDIDITVKKPRRNTINITNDQLIKAIKFLAGRSYECDSYDFKMADGTPVKIFSDEIQIGYDLIPLNDFTLDFYNKLAAESKKNIIDIYINLK